MSVELRQLIRDVAADHPQADPREIARHVAKLTPQENVLDFYAEALEQLTTEVLGSARRSSMDRAMGSLGKGHSIRSPKLEARRGHFARLMAERVHVGSSQWKPVGDCTVDDLRYCISDRLRLIDRTRGQVEHFETLIELMTRHKVRFAKGLIGVIQ